MASPLPAGKNGTTGYGRSCAWRLADPSSRPMHGSSTTVIVSSIAANSTRSSPRRSRPGRCSTGAASWKTTACRSPHPASRRDLQRSAHRRDRHGRHRRPCVGSARTDRLPGQFRWGTTAAAVGATAARGTHRRDPCGISGGLRSVLATNVSNVADLRPFPIDRRRPQRCSDPNRSGDILVRGLSRSLSAAALLRSTRPDFSAIRGGNVRETRAAHDRHRLHDRRLARKNDTCS